MKVTTIINGKFCLILMPENTTDKEILKQLNGGTAQTIASNMSVLQNSVSEGLMITSASEENKK